MHVSKEYIHYAAAIAAFGTVVLISQMARVGKTKTSLTASAAAAVVGKDGSRSGMKRFQLYTNPCCPFAQRVWVVLSELDAIEQTTFTPIPLNAEITRAKVFHALPHWAGAVGLGDYVGLQKLKDWYMANVNKAGEVPSLMDELSSNRTQVFKDSDIVSEYVYQALHGSEARQLDLFPNSRYFAEDVVRFRYAARTFPAGAFYACLRNQDASKDADLYKALRVGLAQFVSHMSSDGPFYLGKQFSFADIFAITVVIRFVHVLPYYRDIDLFAPCSEFNVQRLKTWYSACLSRPSIRDTSPKADEILQLYEGMAHEDRYDEKGWNGRGRSSKQ